MIWRGFCELWIKFMFNLIYGYSTNHRKFIHTLTLAHILPRLHIQLIFIANLQTHHPCYYSSDFNVAAMKKKWEHILTNRPIFIHDRETPHTQTAIIIIKPHTQSAIMIINFHHKEAHYNDVMMGAMASKIIRLTIVYSTVYSVANQRKHQSSASLAFMRGIHRWPVNPRTKGQLRGKCFHLMTSSCIRVMDWPEWSPNLNLVKVFWGDFKCRLDCPINSSHNELEFRMEIHQR